MGSCSLCKNDFPLLSDDANSCGKCLAQKPGLLAAEIALINVCHKFFISFSIFHYHCLLCLLGQAPVCFVWACFITFEGPHMQQVCRNLQWISTLPSHPCVACWWCEQDRAEMYQCVSSRWRVLADCSFSLLNKMIMETLRQASCILQLLINCKHQTQG